MSWSTKKASPTLVWTGIIFSFLSDITRRQTHSYRTRANLSNHHYWVGYSWRGRRRRRFNRMPMTSSWSWTWYACVWVYTERLLSWLCSVARCLVARLWGLISCCWLQNRMTIYWKFTFVSRSKRCLVLPWMKPNLHASWGDKYLKFFHPVLYQWFEFRSRKCSLVIGDKQIFLLGSNFSLSIAWRARAQVTALSTI